jgi:hypothetical protein
VSVWIRIGLCVAAIVLLGSPARGESFVRLLIVRVDDYFFPDSDFIAQVVVDVDVPGVTGVTVSTPMVDYPLENESGTEWETEENFATLGQMAGVLDGEWTISVDGPTPSTSTFSLDASSFGEATFFATPTILEPTNQSTVSTTPTFSWTDPTGAADPSGLITAVGEADDGPFEAHASSFEGTLAVTDTSWQPGTIPPGGDYELDVAYVNVDGSFVSPLSVSSGSITWGDSPIAPPGYPADSPLLLLGSDTIVGFTTVPEASAVLLRAAALGVLVPLARWRRSLRSCGGGRTRTTS